MLGQTISHYQITDKLGAGGMGVVYKALDLKLERVVALKFLPNDLTVSDRDKQGLLREARAASALDHPNIGVIHGIEESEDHQLFIVMGYYEGETLGQKLSRGVIPVRESLDLAIQIARGLISASLGLSRQTALRKASLPPGRSRIWLPSKSLAKPLISAAISGLWA